LYTHALSTQYGVSMKLKILYVAALIGLMAGNVSTVKAEDSIVKYSVKTLEDEARVRDFKYLSYEQLVDDTTRKSKNELLTDDEISRRINSLPKGGCILIDHIGATWDTANGINWTYIVTDTEGKELFRAKGYDHRAPDPVFEKTGVVYRSFFGLVAQSREQAVAPEQTPFGDRIYSSKDEIDIPISLPDSFKVYVVDTALVKRCAYLVEKGNKR